MSQQLDEKSVGPVEVKSEIVMTLQPQQVMGNLARPIEIDDAQLRLFSSDPRVIECLKTFDFKDINFKSLAQHVGFSDQDMKLLDVFWEPTFNNSWIYLSPKLICQDMGYHSVVNFHRDILVQKYKENEDWKEIPSSDRMVISFENQFGEISPKLDEAPKRGRKAKHYAAKGLSLKKMVMCASKADQMRDYFLKLEDLAILMREFMNGLLRYNGWLEKQLTQKLISDQTKRITDLEAQTKGLDQRDAILKQFVQDQAVKKITGWLYIGTSQQDLSVNHFKLGITENLDSRRDKYTKTFSTRANRFYYCEYFALHDPKIVENASKIILKSYHLNDEDRTRQDETYIINYDILHKIVSLLCTNHNGVIELVNTLLETYKDDIYRPSIVVEKGLPKAILCIEMTITSDDRSVTIPLDMDEMTEMERVNACKSIINSYVRNKTQHKAYDIATDEKEAIEPKIEIEADELDKFIKAWVPHGKKGKVKLPAVRHAITSILTGIKNINYLKKPKAKTTIATATPAPATQPTQPTQS